MILGPGVLHATTKLLHSLLVSTCDNPFVYAGSRGLSLHTCTHILLLYLNSFLHEYSCLAPPTMNNYVNKFSGLYIEQRNHLSSTLV